MSISVSETRWAAQYFDGKSAAARSVEIEILPAVLRVIPQQSESFAWPYHELRLAQGRHPGEKVRLERGAGLAEALEIEQQEFLRAVRSIAPHAPFLGSRDENLALKLVVAAAIAIAVLTPVLYFWALPAFAEKIATLVPVSWEESLGEAVGIQLGPPQSRCTDRELQASVDEIMRRLKPRGSPYTYRVAMQNDGEVNAFAAPGGYIVVYRGLIASTSTPEELAGVLAHEIQHVELRHATRGIFRELSFSMMLAVFTGDLGSASSVVQMAAMLGSLSFRRTDEESADRGAMELLRSARVDPQGMVRMFETLRRREGDLPGALQYLSTHPATAERIAALRNAATQVESRSEPLLEGKDWKRIAASCH